MTVVLKSKFFANARGITFADGGGLVWSFNANTNTLTAAGSSGSALSSVGFADTSTTPIYSVSNSPLTSNGTIDITLNTQGANLVFSGPSTGSAAQPTFRALVEADIPHTFSNAVTFKSSGGTSMTMSGFTVGFASIFTAGASEIAAANRINFGVTNASDIDFWVNGVVQFQLPAAGGVNFNNLATTTTAPAAGGAGALPATPKGYATMSINGTAQKIAYY